MMESKILKRLMGCRQETGTKKARYIKFKIDKSGSFPNHLEVFREAPLAVSMDRHERGAVSISSSDRAFR